MAIPLCDVCRSRPADFRLVQQFEPLTERGRSMLGSAAGRFMHSCVECAEHVGGVVNATLGAAEVDRIGRETVLRKAVGEA